MMDSGLFGWGIPAAFIGDRRDPFLATFYDELILGLNLV
jgi:hypothetical protein